MRTLIQTGKKGRGGIWVLCRDKLHLRKMEQKEKIDSEKKNAFTQVV